MGLTKSFGASVALVCCALPPAARAADAPLLLAPVSDWDLDRAEDSCAVRRNFAAGESQVTLEMRAFGPGEMLQITVLSASLPGASGKTRLRFEPDTEIREPAAFHLDIGESRGVLFVTSLRPESGKRRAPLPEWPEADRDAREQAISGLSVGSAFQRTVTLQTGALHEPMNSMRACLDALVARWGLDAETQRTLSRRARPLDLQTWAQRIQASYPTEMVRRGRSGLVNIRLIVGTDGKPTDCIPDRAYSTTGFDEHACALTMRYARFEPALDANGTPVPSLYATTITYQLM